MTQLLGEGVASDVWSITDPALPSTSLGLQIDIKT
jgi:hypothetical protein